jgi:hypothetical protein
VALTFLDRETDAVEKLAMVAGLIRDGRQDTPKRISIDQSAIQEKKLCDFIIKNTLNFFNILYLPAAFL